MKRPPLTCNHRHDVHAATTLAVMRSGAGDPDLVPLDPRVRRLWWLTGALSVVPAAVVATVVDRVAPLPTPAGALPVAIGALGVLLAVVVPVIRYRRWGYALRDRDLCIRRGVLWVTMSVIPYARLQFVDTRQGPFDRAFGLGQLVVHTASLGVSGRLPGLDAEVAERLRERLSAMETDAVTV